MARRRPCVVVAGGRQPAHWAAYAHHQFLHTHGALPCCGKGGCWRARTLPLGDGTELDRPSQLCLDVAGDLPRCMDLITSEEVIRRIDYYFQGGILSYLRPAEARAARKAVDQSPKYSFDQVLTPYTARTASEEFIRRIPPYPGGYSGRGIVICGGGFKYSAPAWVGIKMLRHLGCGLPIELWYLDGAEMDEALQALLAPLGVRTVNGSEIRQQHPTRMWGGWPLKAFSIVHSRFREVLLLDADNLPVVNPEFLFETAEFRRCGALFWPDIRRCKRSQDIWRIAGVPYRTGWEFESGQVLIDKRRCWRPLALALWYNEHADFFYRHVLGDKETFHLAFRKLEHPYAMPAKPVHRLTATMCQHDFEGHRVFQHRNLDKWNLWLFNRRVRGFLYEKESRAFIRELREQWNGRLDPYLRSLGEPLVPLSRTANPPSITAVMISCAQRDEIRRQTLSRLANTDWGTRRVTVFLHSTAEHDFGRSITEKAHQALRHGLANGTDYVLFLEDDLKFNRSIRHNLENWAPLRHGEITLASLYNPDVRVRAVDWRNHCWAVDPASIYGSQALVLSRATVQFILEHWQEVESYPDIKMALLAARLRRPILYHVPSLVQHLGKISVWGGNFHQAADFHPGWRARRVKACGRSL